MRATNRWQDKKINLEDIEVCGSKKYEIKRKVKVRKFLQKQNKNANKFKQKQEKRFANAVNEIGLIFSKSSNEIASRMEWGKTAAFVSDSSHAKLNCESQILK